MSMGHLKEKKNMSCTFFGHGDCYDVDIEKLCCAIENLISLGVDTFYVGNQGYFDRLVFENLLQLKKVLAILYMLVHLLLLALVMLKLTV